MTKKITLPTEFEPEFIAAVTHVFEEQLPFNRLLGLRLTELTPQRVAAGLEMRPDLVGHFVHNRLHGGVISAGLDAIGGLAVMAAIAGKHMDDGPPERMHRFSRLGTIDLRIDYLRPGIGERFTLHGEVLRLGSRVANTRMEFRSENGELLSAGSAAYIVS